MQTFKRTRTEQFDRFFTSLTATFQRAGRTGKPATSERGSIMEAAFETDCTLSDALAASLMLKARTSPSLQAGLDLWNVTESRSWTDSAKRHEGRTLSEIRASLLHSTDEALANLRA